MGAGPGTQVEKVAQLNKSGARRYRDREWDGAKKKLLDALVVAKKAGLDNHPLMARTYVHLGTVYVMGFKNRDKGMQSFRRALEIQPDIRLIAGRAATAEVADVFEEAARRPGGCGDRRAGRSFRRA